MTDQPRKRLRSEIWFNDMTEPGETAVYLERFHNYGITRKELQAGRPIIGIAQSGGDLTPCNRIHLTLAQRVKDGIRDAGGLPFEFPMHPLQESCRRPTAALGVSLRGCAAIPAPYAERAQIAYATGLRIVGMVHEDLTPSRILTREAFENAIVVNTAIGGSTNCPPHITAIARHTGVEVHIQV